MTQEINPIGPQGIQPGSGAAPSKAGQTADGRSFKEILEDSLQHVNQLQQDADLTLERFTRGEASPEEMMVAYKKAQIAFESLMQIRNKLMSAFEEIQRMRI